MKLYLMEYRSTYFICCSHMLGSNDVVHQDFDYPRDWNKIQLVAQLALGWGNTRKNEWLPKNRYLLCTFCTEKLSTHES